MQQQGRLVFLLLFCVLWMGTLRALGAELDIHQRDQLLQTPQIQAKVQELKQLVLADQVDTLVFALQRLALLQQEAIRFLLLKTIEQERLVVLPQVEQFITQQQSLSPVYYVTERGDGYEFSVPAFDFPIIANRLVRQWQQHQMRLDLQTQIERHEFDLKAWLTGDKARIDSRESLLIETLGSISAQEVQFLTHQLTQTPIVSWLPSTKLMVALGQVSQDPSIYRLLWLMKSDQYSESELLRLSRQHDSFSIQQVIAAAHNPRLKPQAIHLLTQLHPMPENVKQYFVAQMTLSDEAETVAQALMKEGYKHWLKDLADSNPQVKQKILLQEVEP